MYTGWKRSARQQRSCNVKMNASAFLCRKNRSHEIICEDRLQLRTISFDHYHTDVLVDTTTWLIKFLLSLAPIIHLDISKSAQCKKDVPLFLPVEYSMTRVVHENTTSRKRFDMHHLFYTETTNLQPAAAYAKRISVDACGTPAKEKEAIDASGRRVRSFRIDWPTRHNRTRSFRSFCS